MDTTKLSPVGAIRLCGGRTYHEGQMLTVVADSDTAVRGMPGVVTIEHARSLVAGGVAIWLKPLPVLGPREDGGNTQPAAREIQI